RFVTADEVRNQDFDSDETAEAGVDGAVDLAHAAGADEIDDLVRPQSGTGVERHARIVRAGATHRRSALRGRDAPRDQRAGRPRSRTAGVLARWSGGVSPPA